MSDHPDPNPALLTWIVLGRVRRGGVKQVGNIYLGPNRRVPDYLVGTFRELITTGLLAVNDSDPITETTRQITLTDAGRARYAVLCQQQRADLSATASPACHRLKLPADSSLHPFGDEELQWARCPSDEWRLHVVQSADVADMPGGEHIRALCGYPLKAADLVVEHGPAGEMCMGCAVDVDSGSPGPEPSG